MQVQTFSGEKRYVVFINQDAIHTHTTPSKTSQHKIQKTSFLVFENYDELIRSQEHAMQSLKERMDTYIEWYTLFQECRIGDSSDISVMQDLL